MSINQNIDAPELSIITVVYNAKETIRFTIDSVLSQTDVSYEYIIIDGGSTDGTIDIIKEYASRLSCFISEADGGIYHAMNKGIASAKGNLIGIINADDWYEHGVFKSVIDTFRHYPGSVIHGDMVIVDSDNTERGYLKAPALPTVQSEFEKMTVNHPATFIPMSVYREHGLFDVSYRLSADYELVIRLLSNGVPFIPMNKVTSYFRLGGQSGGLSTYLENFDVQRKYGRSLVCTTWWFGRAMIKIFFVLMLPEFLVNKIKNTSIKNRIFN